MGRSLREHQKDQSSESDEESNVRHDKFKSERFQENNFTSSTKDKSNSNERYISRRNRDRSPQKSQRHMSSSYCRDDYKKRDQKDFDDKYHSKSSRSTNSNKSGYNKRSKDVNESEKCEVTKIHKNNLSSLLKNFDKKVESKRNNLENPSEIGPLLPPHLKQTEIEKELPLNAMDTSDEIGPLLPQHLKNISGYEESSESDFHQSLNNTSNLKTEVMKNREDTICSEAETVLSVSNDGNHRQTILKDTETCILKSDTESKILNVNSTECDTQSSEFDASDPAMPQKNELGMYGPSLPPKIKSDSYGPSLPPSFVKDFVQGPALPPGMSVEMIQEDSDDDVVGPQPEGIMSTAQYNLDLRAKHIKRKLDEEKNGPSKELKKREEWMLELPPEKASNLGLGPRSFRMREAPDMTNRSNWTDTPADKLRKEQQALRGESEPVSSEEMARVAFIKERDTAMDQMSQLSQDKDRAHSLLELHQKKLKKKKKKEEKDGKKKERRPFDRNIDLQVNRFDEAQKKAIFKKAQLLDSRFSTGESKYL